MRTILHRLLWTTALVLLAAYSQAQTYADIHDFNNTDGCCANYPSMMAQGEDGNIYGATTSGGKTFGNIFMMTPSGALTDIHDFDLTHGGGPQGGISLAMVEIFMAQPM